jgi:hypothetical protein
MADELTVPLLPCQGLDELLDFYRTLGFEVTYEQTSPYVYAAVKRGATDLHFHKPKGKDIKKTSGTCLIFVPKIETYYRAFTDALRTRYGKVPTAGEPRITRLQKGQTRFTLFDPAGNNLVYIVQDEPDRDYSAFDAPRSKMMHAVEMAAFLRDVYTDDKAAAQVLDKALAKDEPAEPIDRALALAARAELAVAMDDSELLKKLREQLRRMKLSAKEREQYSDELRASDELERWREKSNKPKGR